jgi:hypothetical protein
MVTWEGEFGLPVVEGVEEGSMICVERLEKCSRECQRRMPVECIGPAGYTVVAGQRFAEEMGRKLKQVAEGE